MFPESINSLIESFKKLPGVGQKSAERMVFSILNSFDDSDYEEFCGSLVKVKDSVGYCSSCNCLTDGDICNICSDKSRKSDVLMVVEASKDVFTIEKMGNFDGYYYVLGGFISPFDNIGPEDINVFGLIEKIKSLNVKEVVFVVKSCIEADTTILYIKRLLKDVDVLVSRVANGIPVGADVDYIDTLTLESAFNNRMEVLD